MLGTGLPVLGFQTTQGNCLSCRDQEGRRGPEEAVAGPSVFPSGYPGVSGDFWGLQEGCQGPFRPSCSVSALLHMAATRHL